MIRGILLFSWAFTAILTLGIAFFKLFKYQELNQNVIIPFVISLVCSFLFFKMSKQKEVIKEQ